MNFEARHELALETAVGLLLARKMMGEPGHDNTIRDLRDLMLQLTREQVLARHDDGNVVPLHAVYADDTGYALGDPKHPSYHDSMSDLWDMREGK